jgi:hypothetical protein
MSTKAILLLGCVALALTALAAWAALRKPAESTLVSVTVSIAPVAAGSRAGCAVNSKDGIFLPGSNGRSWINRGDHWCEYGAGKLVGQWQEVPRMGAVRLLSVRDGRVDVGRVAPDLANGVPYRPKDCGASVGKALGSGLPRLAGLAPCREANVSGRRYRYGLRTYDSGPLPVFSVEPANQRVATIVSVLGGPYSGFPSDFDNAQMLLHLIAAASDAAVLMPFHLGTHNIVVDGTDNFALGIRQLEALLDEAAAEAPGRPLCVIGGSLGGYAVTMLAHRPAMRKLLVSPLMSSPIEMVARFERQPDYLDEEINLVHVPAPRWIQGFGPSDLTPRRGRRAAAFLTYMRGQRDKPLLSRLDPRDDVTILYGSADRNIGTQWAPRLRERLGARHVIDVGPLEHGSQMIHNYWAFEPHVRDFLESCGATTRSAT